MSARTASASGLRCSAVAKPLKTLTIGPTPADLPANMSVAVSHCETVSGNSESLGNVEHTIWRRRRTRSRRLSHQSRAGAIPPRSLLCCRWWQWLHEVALISMSAHVPGCFRYRECDEFPGCSENRQHVLANYRLRLRPLKACSM